jgi:predicted DNA-binding transcriptional regulator
MNKDQVIGAVILVGSIIGVLVYGWLVYAFPIMILQITAFVAVAAVLVILAWIGWTMATTPAPAPFEPETTQASGSASSEEKSPQTTSE